MSGPQFVFLDPKGRRWLWIRAGVAIVVVTLLVLLVVFIRALWVKPELHMPENLRKMKSQMSALARTPKPMLPAAQTWQIFRKGPHPRIKGPAIAARPGDHKRVAAALLAGWDTRSLAALLHHAPELTHVCPDMFTVAGQPAVLRTDTDEEMLLALRASRLKVVPVLSNLVGDKWDTDAIEGLLQQPPAGRQAFIDKIASTLQSYGAAGVLLDWQGIDRTYADALVDFLKQLRQTLKADNLELWLSIPVGEDLSAFDLERIPDYVDHLVAQLHDENAEDDEPGPVASRDWFEGWMGAIMGYGDPGQWIISLGTYGYDWNKATKKVVTLSFADAMARAQESGVDPVTSSAPDYNPSFDYDRDGQDHEVWFLDATTFANQYKALGEWDCGGVMLNRLGTEDPGVWKVLADHTDAAPDPSVLHAIQDITPGKEIAQLGEGDFLSADLTADPGRRVVWRDGSDYVCETYEEWPSYPTVWHFGNTNPNHVALTFDDGPDPTWTPQILKILRDYKVRATFFVLGKHAEEHPALIRQILKEGHEIGSHTYTHPNLSEISSDQARLQLNATQRLLEWLTGRSTILFRPPYNADSMPGSLDDVKPIALATELGYMTVGESIDPQDWDRPGTDEIVRRVKEQRTEGNVILLHDAGGDRSQTVAALPRILDYLRDRGDMAMPAGKLLGLHRAQTMPAVSEAGGHTPTLITNAGLLTLRWAESFLWAFMIVTSLLTLTRSIGIAVLALKRKDKPANAFRPPLSVIIAAYNEDKVIEATLQSLLKSEYPGEFEIVVVDDGSKDETAARAESLQSARVRVVRQENTGKAGALAHGFALAKHDVLVLLDADTQFQPDTLTHLVQALEDPKVGAVSGHARVGNLRTWMARFQSLEYICGFNLDRRAYDQINAITVVPGAVSALRREAVVQAGGFASDTIAEDTDLTLSLHRAGWRVTYTPEAVAWTEAPESIKTLSRQRFRWAFGTMQCLWKHRDLILNTRFGGLGCVSLPSVVLFQILLVAAVPIVDFLLIISLATGAGTPFLLYFLAFLLCDLALALLACWIEGEPLWRAAWIIPMRFVYRPVLSYVVWRSILQMLRGAWVGWGKLERKGSVSVPAYES